MSNLKWLRIVQQDNKGVNVKKVRRESIETGEMAAGAPVLSAQKLARIMGQRDATAKILVVGDGAFSEKLSGYALKMGLRLDCEIVALSIFDRGAMGSGAVGEKEETHFKNRSEIGGALFADRAASSGVKLCQLSRVGIRKVVIDEVVKEIPGIRYVLTEPDGLVVDDQEIGIQLPLIDTTGSNS